MISGEQQRHGPCPHGAQSSREKLVTNKQMNKYLTTNGGTNRGLSLPEEPALKPRLKGCGDKEKQAEQGMTCRKALR